MNNPSFPVESLICQIKSYLNNSEKEDATLKRLIAKGVILVIKSVKQDNFREVDLSFTKNEFLGIEELNKMLNILQEISDSDPLVYY